MARKFRKKRANRTDAAGRSHPSVSDSTRPPRPLCLEVRNGLTRARAVRARARPLADRSLRTTSPRGPAAGPAPPKAPPAPSGGPTPAARRRQECGPPSDPHARVISDEACATSEADAAFRVCLSCVLRVWFVRSCSQKRLTGFFRIGCADRFSAVLFTLEPRIRRMKVKIYLVFNHIYVQSLVILCFDFF